MHDTQHVTFHTARATFLRVCSISSASCDAGNITHGVETQRVRRKSDQAANTKFPWTQDPGESQEGPIRAVMGPQIRRPLSGKSTSLSQQRRAKRHNAWPQDALNLFRELGDEKKEAEFRWHDEACEIGDTVSRRRMKRRLLRFLVPGIAVRAHPTWQPIRPPASQRTVRLAGGERGSQAWSSAPPPPCARPLLSLRCRGSTSRGTTSTLRGGLGRRRRAADPCLRDRWPCAGEREASPAAHAGVSGSSTAAAPLSLSGLGVPFVFALARLSFPYLPLLAPPLTGGSRNLA